MPESPELHAHYDAAPTDGLRETLTLIAGAWLGVPAVAEKTGLISTQPPEDVHAMARGPLAAAGGFYEADLIADALASVGRRAGRPRQRARLRLLLRARAARARGCLPRDRLARLRSRTPRRSRGPPSNFPASNVFVERQRPAATAGGRLARSRLRDLDLVAFRADARPALVRGDAPRDPPRRAPRLHDPRA